MITAVGDNELPQESSANYDYAHPNDHHTGPYLMGPMVIRVYPDGRPVPSDAQRPLPKDEDIEDIRYSRLPTIKDLEAAKKSAVVAVVAAPTSAPATAAASDNVKTFSEPPRELLPPRKSVRSNFYRIGAPARFYSRIARPNNLLVRERYYWTGHTYTEREYDERGRIFLSFPSLYFEQRLNLVQSERKRERNSERRRRAAKSSTNARAGVVQKKAGHPEKRNRE